MGFMLSRQQDGDIQVSTDNGRRCPHAEYVFERHAAIVLHKLREKYWKRDRDLRVCRAHDSCRS
jgi:hypothetical protein